MNLIDELRKRLMQNFPDALLEIRDQTGQGNHLELIMVSSAFSGLKPLKRQQLIYSKISDLWEGGGGGLHALTMKLQDTQELSN